MSKKSIFILSFVLLLLSLVVQTTPVLGDDWWTPRTVPSDFSNYQDDWVGGEGTGGNTGNWCTPGNWAKQRSATSAPPDPNTTAELAPKTLGPNILGDCPATCSRLDLQPWSWAGAPNLDCNVAPTAGMVDCGVVINICGRTDFDSSTQGHGILNVYGGTMYTPGVWPAATPGGQADMNGLYVGGGSSKAAACYGIVNQYGGLISVPKVAVYNGIVNLYGGTLEHTRDTSNQFIIATRYARNAINIVNGQLVLQGNRVAEVEDYCDAGLIIPCNNRGYSRVLYNYNTTIPGHTTVTAFCDWGATWNPTPVNNSEEMPMNPATPLSWTPGDYVNTVPEATRIGWGQVPADTNGHRVYLGTNFNEVDTAVPGPVVGKSVYRGAFDSNVYDVNSRYGPLDFNTTYYWRVDEVNVGTTGSPWKGVVWHLTTSTGKAYDPYPPTDSNIGFDVNKLYLRWTKGLLTQSTNGHQVYFGTDYDEVRIATTATPVIYRGTTTDANYALIALSPDYTLVSEANYYWRVDEVNVLNPISPWEGRIWRMIFPNNYTVDNFNSYASAGDMNYYWKQNKVSGLCPGGGHQDPGGVLLLDQTSGVGSSQAMVLDYNNTGKVRDRFSEARREEPITGTDWTVAGSPSGQVKLLHISYNGLADNNADPCLDRMYVAIGDTCSIALKRVGPVIYNPDPYAQRKTSWTDWYVKISDISYDLNYPGTPVDINLHKVRYLFVGLGLRCNIYGSTGIPGGGSGRVMFDDIWLTQPLCNARYGPAADFTNDCLVDLQDVDIFVNDWLSSNTTLSYPDACAPSAPVLWYDFNETDGNIAHNTGTALSAYLAKYLPGDSNTYDACVMRNRFVDVGNRLVQAWDTNGYIGGCINLVYGRNSYVNVPASVLAPFASPTGPNGVTFSFWVDMDDINYPVSSEWPAVIGASTSSAGSAGVEDVRIECPISGTPQRMHVIIGGAELYVENMKHSDFGGRWNHYAVVKDADTNTLSIYHNGELLASTVRTDIGKPLFTATPLVFKVGERGGWDPSVIGRIDDVKMYDYALNANQIQWLAASGTTSLYVPLVNPNANGKGSSNFKISERVDFGDFALFANQWLYEQLWP